MGRHTTGAGPTTRPTALECSSTRNSTGMKDSGKMIYSTAKARKYGPMAPFLRAGSSRASSKAKACTIGPMAAAMMASGKGI